MAQNSETIKHRTLLNLTLPGSHDSAAYQLNGHIMPGELPWALREILLLAERLGMSSETYIIKWSETQVLTLPEQLHNGIRFLDLRAGGSLRCCPILTGQSFRSFTAKPSQQTCTPHSMHCLGVYTASAVPWPLAVAS